jgi:nitrogen regulatory protein PII-like uncharacterized protein
MRNKIKLLENSEDITKSITGFSFNDTAQQGKALFATTKAITDFASLKIAINGETDKLFVNAITEINGIYQINFSNIASQQTQNFDQMQDLKSLQKAIAELKAEQVRQSEQIGKLISENVALEQQVETLTTKKATK